ncbi:hypothetical protein L3X38_003519 [Prunus dulcis]|uniref:No apical meristem-associated C-terminal domain-containing protein n=1 Tax=Prunus dulcis TaxID=3755 RepID=A0AAD5F269_PRUDU|nr:hypothetical protein L3X38_003519 [Prunus dulcis]
MGSSNENGGAWSMMEDVSLCEAWVQKVLNKELGKWRNALAKAIDNHRSGENLSSEIMQAQMWFGATGQRKKSFNHTHCWEVVKTCKRFQIIPTGPTVVLNETPLHETPASDSHMDSPMSQDSPIENEPRPVGRKAAKAKRGSNSSKNASQFLEELSKHQAMRIEMDLKQQEHDMAIQVEYAKEREGNWWKCSKSKSSCAGRARAGGVWVKKRRPAIKGQPGRLVEATRRAGPKAEMARGPNRSRGQNS